MKVIVFLLMFGSITQNLCAETAPYSDTSNLIAQNDVRKRGYTIIGVQTAISDLVKIKAQNVNFVKWMFFRTVPWTDVTDFTEYQTWLSKELDKFDSVLIKANQLDLKVILELMDAPGGRYTDGSQRLFYNNTFNDQYVKVWKQIAKRYKGNTALYGYGLLNEPVTTKKLTVLFDNIESQSKAASAIRAIDTLTPLIFSSTNWNNPTPFFNKKLPFKNVIYEVHFYEPHEYTHHGVNNSNLVSQSYPGYMSGWKSYFDKAKLKSNLNTVRSFQLANNAKILVGEFSVVRWAAGGSKYLADCKAIFEEYDWDWLYHCWTDEQAWGPEFWSLTNMDGTLGSNPKIANYITNRERVILDGFSLNAFSIQTNVSLYRKKSLKGIDSGDSSNISPSHEMENVLVYPNPTNGSLSISNIFENCSNSKLKIYNCRGQRVEGKNIPFRCEGGFIIINISSLTSGLYYIQITDKEKRLFKKVIKL